MTKLLGVLVAVLAACADDESDPHRIVECESTVIHNGTPVTRCEAACSPFPGLATGPACTLEDGTPANVTHQWLPTRIHGLCVVEPTQVRFLECVD